MIFNLNNPIDRSKATKRIRELWQKNAVVELKEKRLRTLKQNSYLHVILSYFGVELGYTLEEAKKLYKVLNKDLYEYEKPGLFQKPEKFYRSSAELDTAELTITIDKFRNYSSIEAGTYLPGPNEKGYIQEAEIRVSRNQQYL